MLTVGVLISGSGTNLQAILDRAADGTLGARVGVVVSNRAAARGLDRASAAGVATHVVDHRAFARREEFDAAVVEILRATGVGLVALAGFDRIVTPVLLSAFPQRLINLHPALLPAVKGLHVQPAAVR